MTFWIDVLAIKAWDFLRHYGHNEREFIFSDAAIETAVMVKGTFKIPPRGLKGFLNSGFTLLNVPLKSPIIHLHLH
ncbi:Mobile element protein [Candidatus Enterovibrio escicola]|uniref:Mobile element protein n=1 Tax=Candidatus Enterovibrio escicola TaxID=1927127 RepID=A0A2A5T2E2_9GAMM|nr:Mobile element protein [Candidatus Enterovibrio escacola]